MRLVGLDTRYEFLGTGIRAAILGADGQSGKALKRMLEHIRAG
jgi:hypothetical protein